jgi:hypothetical protein
MIFKVIIGIFHGVLEFLCLYSTISHRTFNDVPQNGRVSQNPGWRTLV